MALAVPYQTVATVTSTAGTVYTIPNSPTSNYGTYARDLVVTNSGTATCFVQVAPSGAVPTTAASFAVPVSGSVVLTQCQVPAGGVVTAITASGVTGQVSVGFASVVSVI